MDPSIFKITPIKNQLKIRLYMDQLLSVNQAEVADPKKPNNFGQFWVNDWPLYDSTDSSKKVIARVTGKHIQGGMEKAAWYYTLNLVFEDDRFKGSTLQVLGNHQRDGEWAIVGGTGEFIQAQGVLHKRIVRESINQRLMEVNINALYAPPKEAPWAAGN